MTTTRSTKPRAPRAAVRLTTDQRASVLALIGELADLASYRDIDVSLGIAESLAATLGVKPKDIPGYDTLAAL